jgi:hypothetical protein
MLEFFSKGCEEPPPEVVLEEIVEGGAARDPEPPAA